MYRVRKSWSDAKSQIGAFEVLDNAKRLVDKNPGYKVYGDGGKLVYPEPKDTKMSVKTTYVEAMEPLFTACKKICNLLYKSIYQWVENPTLEKSKSKSTCVSFEACVLQDIDILKLGQYIWHNGKGYGSGKIFASGFDINNSSLMDVIYLDNQTPAKVKKKLKAGDVFMHDDNKSGKKGDGGHTCIFKGEYDGSKALCYSGGCGSGKNTSKNYADKRKLLGIVRLKTYKITNQCINGSLSGASLVLAKQDVTFKYAPNAGRKLKSVTVDGKKIDIKKHPTSYTFKSVEEAHSIKVVYA